MFKINNRLVGRSENPLVIAEIGINHEGSFSKAIKMIDDAYKAGCECVKFQSHIIEDEMIPNNVIPGNADESIWDIMDRCSLTTDEEIKIKNYVESKNMLFLSTPFSRASADHLESIGVKWFKIGSGECNNYPLVEHVAGFGKPIIISTGMNDIKSIKPSVSIMESLDIPHALMHCTSMYPTPYHKVKLGCIDQMSNEFPNSVIGLSDHSLGNYTCFAAISLGARVLEKHFTSNKNWPGPDVSISLDPLELKDLVDGSKAIFNSLGGEKKILPEEKPTIDFAYACVVSIDEIKEGQIFTKNNIWVKRPGTGEIKAKYFKKIIGKKANINIPINTQIKWDFID